MELLKERVEKASGDAFIEWLNRSLSESYEYKGRAGEAPDLVYSNGKAELKIEHTGAYYDTEHAEFLWDGIRNPEIESDEGWLGVNSDASLAEAIKKQIEKKSSKDYGERCILLVEVPPGVTSEIKLKDLLFPFPSCEGMERFMGIYVAGRFPSINGVGGGYHVLTIKELCS